MTAPTTLHSTRSVAARALRTFILVYQAAPALGGTRYAGSFLRARLCARSY